MWGGVLRVFYWAGAGGVLGWCQGFYGLFKWISDSMIPVGLSVLWSFYGRLEACLVAVNA